MSLTLSSAPACALKNLINTGTKGEKLHQYRCGASLSQSELIHQTVPSVCSDVNRTQKPTAEGQEAVKSFKQWVNQAVDQSVIETVSRAPLASLSGVSVRSEPQAESLIPARVFDTTHCCLGVTHTHINTQRRTVTDAHAESHPPSPVLSAPRCV